MLNRLIRFFASLCVMAAVVSPLTARATLLEFNLNTSSLAGVNTLLAFDLIGDSSNTVSVKNFDPSGPSTAGVSTGSVGGIFPFTVTLSNDLSYFNEASALVPSLSNSIIFQIETTENPPLLGGVPDALSLFFLNPTTLLPLFPTGDPTGANALFLLNIDGSTLGNLITYDSSQVSVEVQVGATAIPEPSTPALVLPLLFVLLLHLTRGKARGIAFLLACTLAGTAFQVKADDLSGTVGIAKSGAVLNRLTNTFDSVVTVSNTSNTVIAGPMLLTIKNISAPGVSVYNSRATDAEDNPIVVASLTLGVLQPGAKVAVPVKFINKNLLGFNYTVAVSGAMLTSSNSAPLNVRVFVFSGNQESPRGAPAGAGVQLSTDGVVRAVTDASGQATFLASLNTSSVSAKRPPTFVGTADVTIVQAAENSIDLVMSDDGEVYGEASLRIDQVQQLLLPSTFNAFAMRFVNATEATVKIVDLALVELFDSAGMNLGNITSMFSLRTDGTIRVVDINVLRSLLNSHSGELTIAVTGIDALENVYLSSARFYVSHNKVRGHLLAPASPPSLALGGIRVVGKMLNTNIVVSTLSDEFGGFEFPDLPNGNLSITSQTLQNERYYYGAGVFSVAGAANLYIPLLSALDSGVAGFASPSVQSLLASPSSEEIVIGYNARRPSDVQSTKQAESVKSAATLAGASAASVSVSVSAAGKDVPIEKSANLNVTKGTTKVTLVYNVATAEYPYYVTQQSIYNDVWGVKLFGGPQGAQLFGITRQINSQLVQAPIWQSDGTTGQIEKTFDVAALTKDADIELILTAFAINRGDSELATTVNAQVAADGKLTINSVLPMDVAWGTKNNGTYYSVPASGSLNTFHRKATIDITKPDDAALGKLKIELLGAGDDSLVLDETAGSNVTLVGEKSIQSLMTFKSNSSTINGVPPPINAVQYRYTLRATAADGTQLSDEKIDGGKRPLWRMPTGFARYSIREPGFDDWCSYRTYMWMQEHASLLKAINDISGEHGKDLGHATHGKGSDIDMYHFYLFQGASPASGTSNYEKLVARIKDLPKKNSVLPAQIAIGNAAALEVAAWINASRIGIDALAAEPAVLQVGYIRAGPNSTGISGNAWGEVLLKTGIVTVDGTVFDLGTGSWDNIKYQPWPNHHHHLHITLDPAD